MKKLVDTRLADPTAERVRASTAEAIRELQDQPAASARIFTVTLPDNAETIVSHGLGRAPQHVSPGVVRGAAANGLLRDFGSKSPITGIIVDRAKSLILRTDGFGATVTFDIEVK